MARQKERIDTSGGAGLQADNPFAALSGAGLPQAAPKPVEPTEPEAGPGRRRETLLLRRLKAGKGGKVVTELSGFDAAPQEVEALLKRLQARMGTGGTCKGRVIELQGECRDRVRPLLEGEGYRVKG